MLDDPGQLRRLGLTRERVQARIAEGDALPRREGGILPAAPLADLDAGRPDVTPDALSSDPAAREVQIENRIRAAYRELQRRPGDWVALADLREKLAGLDRDDVDRALKALALQPGGHVIPWDNRKVLTRRDHDASVRIGGDDSHAIRLEDPSPRPLPAPSSPAARKVAAPAKAAKKAAPSRAAAPSPTGEEGLSTDPAVRRVQIENRIRAAYLKLVNDPDRFERQRARIIAETGLTPISGYAGLAGAPDWVGIADIRDELGWSVDRHEVDSVLKKMALTGAVVSPIADQKILTRRDRDLAVHLGGQAKHAIHLDDPSPRPLPSSPTPAKTSRPKATGLAANTIPQLRELAKQRGITVPAKARKADIIALLGG
jgi:hypothetical protein